MFHRLGDHVSINMTEQEVPLKPMSKPAGNNIKFPSHLCVCGRGEKKNQMRKMKMHRKEKPMR